MMVNLDEYERKVEADIRKVKDAFGFGNRSKENIEAKKLENLENFHQSGLCLVERSCILKGKM